MCGVIGVYLNDVKEKDLQEIEQLFVQSQIRGKHATGVTYLKEGNLTTIKEPVAAKEFVSDIDFADFVRSDGSLVLIGHTRYSTSDLMYNQPIESEDIAIVHNGVISQEPIEDWEFRCKTKNDSELILQVYLNTESHPLEMYHDRSMAVCSLGSNGTLTAFRNHERPLWYLNRGNGVVFASTRDILNRTFGVIVESPPQRTQPFVNYLFNDSGMFQRYYGEQDGVQDLQP